MLLQRQSDQPVCRISHEEGDVQNISNQFRIVQREPETKLKSSFSKLPVNG